MFLLIYSKTILARVIFKSTKKEFNGGCLFFINLMDDTGVIKCIGYNRDCNRFYNVIKVKIIIIINMVDYDITSPNSVHKSYRLMCERI